MTVQTLLEFTSALLKKAGLSKKAADIVAKTLIESDLLGHTTHGLALLEAYVKDIEGGNMATKGKPICLNKKGAMEVWNGQYLAGPYLIELAIERAIKRVKRYGTYTIAIQKSHHIACLAAYLEVVARQNLMIYLSCADPRIKTIAPFGGKTPVYSPNPIAIGIPTSTDPIIIDVSTSATANGIVNQKYALGEKLPHAWLLGNDGEPTDDPTTFFQSPASTILPLGGMDSGYKGFGFGIMVEAMTNALGGFGRAEQPKNWGASVFLQIIDPSVFGGLEPFLTEVDFFKNAALQSVPLDASKPVRLPGSRGLELKKQQLENGVNLSETILASLKRLGEKYKITVIT
ncbi:MAG: Ldh family oxidoreductase [Saprospiraceae bacterium]|nr:Ldh family oxidoreductase [Saprospiraceae bacterium]